MTILGRVKERVENWLTLRRETAFETANRQRAQAVNAAMLPLSQIGKGTADHISTVPRAGRPGTLTVTVGDESATLDPMDSTPKFLRDRARIDELLAKIGS